MDRATSCSAESDAVSSGRPSPVQQPRPRRNHSARKGSGTPGSRSRRPQPLWSTSSATSTPRSPTRPRPASIVHDASGIALVEEGQNRGWEARHVRYQPRRYDRPRGGRKALRERFGGLVRLPHRLGVAASSRTLPPRWSSHRLGGLRRSLLHRTRGGERGGLLRDREDLHANGDGATLEAEWNFYGIGALRVPLERSIGASIATCPAPANDAAEVVKRDRSLARRRESRA